MMLCLVQHALAAHFSPKSIILYFIFKEYAVLLVIVQRLFLFKEDTILLI